MDKLSADKIPYDNPHEHLPGPLLPEVLKADTRPVDPLLIEKSYVFMGDEDLDVSRYISQEFHDAEMERMWSRVWQVACQEQDLPDVGDHILYEIGLKQILVVRTQTGQIKAYPNACLHRGTALRTCSGNVQKFRCPFHGFTWSLDGKLVEIPDPWDFPHVTQENFCLPEIRVGLWGGFVFICLSKETEPLESYIHDLPAHFAEWPLEERRKVAHVAKVVRCNWKTAMEAFLEGYHVPIAHPQSDGYTGDTQYDVWPDKPHISRVQSATGAPDPRIGTIADVNVMIDAIVRDIPVLGKPGDVRLQEGQFPRAVLAQRFRDVLEKSTGADLSQASDHDMLDPINYLVFPNFVPWRGVGAPLAYRFRPYKNDPNACVMEVMYLFVQGKDAPKVRGAPIHWLGENETFIHAKELGGLGVVLDQDLNNLERVQTGLHSTQKAGVTLANYQEIRIRHYHRVIDDYLARSVPEKPKQSSSSR